MRPLCREFAALLRRRIALREEKRTVLALLERTPRPAPCDVGYDSATGQFSFRDAHGVVRTEHPATSEDGSAPAYSADGSVVAPLSPPHGSSFVLCPERDGGWCYYDTEQGRATWFAPEGSTALRSHEVRPFLLPASPPPDVPAWLGLGMLRNTDWMLVREDAANRLLLVSKVTGAVREAPWISLLSTTGVVYFVNLISHETRWLPPHRWMEAWVARPEHEADEVAGTWPGLPIGPRRPDERDPLPQCFARRRVDGGAPYMHESGAPQYPPDERDTAVTYPMYAGARHPTDQWPSSRRDAYSSPQIATASPLLGSEHSPLPPPLEAGGSPGGAPTPATRGSPVASAFARPTGGEAPPTETLGQETAGVVGSELERAASLISRTWRLRSALRDGYPALFRGVPVRSTPPFYLLLRDVSERPVGEAAATLLQSAWWSFCDFVGDASDAADSEALRRFGQYHRARLRLLTAAVRRRRSTASPLRPG